MNDSAASYGMNKILMFRIVFDPKSESLNLIDDSRQFLSVVGDRVVDGRNSLCRVTWKHRC